MANTPTQTPPTPAQLAQAIRGGRGKPFNVMQLTPSQVAELSTFLGGNLGYTYAVPASITHTWDSYCTTLTRTAPYNLRRAARATRALRGLR